VHAPPRRPGQVTLTARDQLAPIAGDFLQDRARFVRLVRLQAECDALTDAALDVGEPSGAEGGGGGGWRGVFVRFRGFAASLWCLLGVGQDRLQ